MASIFTYDPDPPRVSSPWSSSRASTPMEPPVLPPAAENSRNQGDTQSLKPKAVLETDALVTRLEAEPQEGPTEYKLHLLLRPRRSFTITNTARGFRGSHSRSLRSSGSRSVSETGLSKTPPKASSAQSRQHRLEQLTTQLLWRLQQSSPYHASTANELVIPQLPDASPQLETPRTIGKLVPGLEESKGALYEIGVADDGTFVGLAGDEMEESLANLRAMAASLGCTVEVLRMVAIGECEWYETPHLQDTNISQLWVAEAFIRPDVRSGTEMSDSATQAHPLAQSFELDHATVGITPQPPVQLRISLTGATMSGKSSLLGSLSTATLDNGRGKSRLSLLKHRHEIVSGMTSSVTQELIGYHETPNGKGDIRVVNYASGNVSSWNDIHAACQGGRLVFLSDSAGHPRYRRTTVRGLLGWGPHFTLLCMPADNAEDTCGKSGSTPSAEEVLGAGAADVDLSQAHLDLCLKLHSPLVVAVTKLDLASRAGLRQSVSKLLTTLKSAGRKPVLIADKTTLVSEEALGIISATDLATARRTADELAEDPLGIVPVVLISAVKGSGIRKLHALLHELHIPAPATPQPGFAMSESGTSKHHGVPSVLYHVEDIYKLNPSRGSTHDNLSTSIISGHLKYGRLNLGDELILGPYHTDTSPAEDSDSSSSPRPDKGATSIPASRSFPGALENRFSSPLHPLGSGKKQREWRRTRITSIRNLRLPVRTLYAGQVGTLGIEPVDETIQAPALSRIRKGMVIASRAPDSRRAFVARFSGDGVRSLIVGSLVVVYIASVRASAKVIAIAIDEDLRLGSSGHDSVGRHESNDFGFDFEDDSDGIRTDETRESESTLVTFQFVATKEYVELGAQVLVMEGGRKGNDAEKNNVGLEGFVGSVVDGYG
ncbi:hypothetical protein K490DRAFT_46919 [Saccharata proteae CBS 121410]|uniref:Tr-type G domain-containing protein n=1 Tax=Saccharata proteae CBS 121410 TaxID=1314787 RepID=A0A9P4HRG0_9PEZI|nr:hypothetical protein K490DRAFT_46919 [Saccharata proteae CBS 121410]